MRGKKKFQRLFELLNRFSLHGMNMGKGSNPEISGEKNALHYIQGKLHSLNDLILFDVGANIGHYSILLRNFFGDKATIYAFEPSKVTFRKLEDNTADEAGIRLFNFGMGNEKTKILLYTNHDESGLASVYKRRLDHFNIDMNKSEEVEIRTVDDYCAENKIQRINFLKLDVEGHELNVLEGATEMLNSGAIDFIQFEFGGCNIDSRTYFQDFYYLLKDQYRIFRILKDGLYPIKEYSEMYEVFITTNYLAERKH